MSSERPQVVTISKLFSCPVKAMSMSTVHEASFSSSGMVGDRLGMIITRDGKHVNQLRESKLVTVCVELQDNKVRFIVNRNLAFEFTPSFEGTPVDCNIYGSPCRGVVQGEAVNAWINQFLGSNQGYRLVWTFPSNKRLTNLQYTTPGSTVGGYPDRTPIHFVSTATLTRVRQVAGVQFPARALRPTFIIDGLETAFAEDEIVELRSRSGLVMRAGKQCGRCPVINVHPATGAPKAWPAYQKLQQTNRLMTCPKSGRREVMVGMLFSIKSLPAGQDVISLRVGETLYVYYE